MGSILEMSSMGCFIKTAISSGAGTWENNALLFKLYTVPEILEQVFSIICQLLLSRLSRIGAFICFRLLKH